MIAAMRRAMILLALCAGPAPGAEFEDYERAREAVERGEILPLADILRRVEAEHDARMIEVEFDTDGVAHSYELELITREGRIIEVLVDAATGETISVADEDRDEED
jgi:uncharacterized membrane protein YkoI